MEEQAKLLAECLDVLETIQNDGWVIRGGNSTVITDLIPRLDKVVNPPVAVHHSFTFHCVDCSKSQFVSRASFENVDFREFYCDCEAGYRVWWQDIGNPEIRIIKHGRVASK